MKKKDYYAAKYELLKENYNARLLEREKAKNRDIRQKSVGLIGGILGFILLFLLIVFVFRLSINSASMPTFTSFLETITSFEPLHVADMLGTIHIVDDWGIFNFIRDYINTIFAPILEVAMFLIANIINIFIYLYQFIKWIFILP